MTDEEFAKLFPSVKWPKTVELKDRTQIVPPLPSSSSLPRGFFDIPVSKDTVANPSVGGISNYIPTPREKLAYFLNETFFGDDRAGLDRAEFLLRPIDVSPAAIPFASYDATRAIGEGRYKDAILPTITAVAPFIGKPSKLLSGVKPRGPGESFVENFPNPVVNRITKEIDEAPTSNVDQTLGNGSNAIKKIEADPGPYSQNAPEISANAYEADFPKSTKGSEFDKAEDPSVASGRYPRAAQSDEGMPKQTFLTEGLEKKRHNYPPDQTIAADAKKQIFEPPDRPQRPFADDYPNGAIADETGNLLVDKYGNPLIAKYRPGRRTLGGDDVGLTHDEFHNLAEDLIQKKIEMVRAGTLGRDGKTLGQLSYNYKTNEPRDIRIVDNLSKEDENLIKSHEAAHAVDVATGRQPIDTPEMHADLERIYSDLATGIDGSEPLTLPSSRGYSGAAYRDELMGEGLRAAITRPNYLKSHWPKTYDILADRIAKSKIAHLLQLNSLAAAAGVGLGLFGQREDSQAGEPNQHRDVRSNRPEDTDSNFGPSVPSHLRKGGAKATSQGIPMIADALIKRGLSVQVSKAGKFHDLARALIKAQRNSLFYGGPR